MGEHKLWVIYKDLYDFITEQTRKVNIQKKNKPYDFFLKIVFSAFLQSLHQSEKRDNHL